MGFFKNIGKSLKGLTKMVSLKNAVGVATGNTGGLVKEAVGRLASPHVASSKVREIVESQGVAHAEAFVKAKSQGLSDHLANEVAKNSAAQNLGGFFTKAYLLSFWQMHKTKILIGLGIVTLGFIYLFTRKKGVTKGGVRTK